MKEKLLIALLILVVALTKFSETNSVDKEINRAAGLNQQAAILYREGNYQEALPLLRRAMEIKDKILGPKHENTATSLIKLALLYQAIGQYDKALPLGSRAPLPV